jgi:hypothetical protein
MVPRSASSAPRKLCSGITGGRSDRASGQRQQHGGLVCIGGHTTVPKEQKTQQWPGSGRNSVWQFAHS